MTDICGIAFGCVNAQSAGNKTATLCRTIVDVLDVFIITETWLSSSSAVLRQICPPEYQCVDAARPIPPDAHVSTVDFQNHGGLAFVHRSTVNIRRRTVDCSIKTFEYLCGDASSGDSCFVQQSCCSASARQSGSDGCFL